MDKNGWVWGRGTTDMKSTLIALMSSTEKLLSEGFVPERTILYSFVRLLRTLHNGADNRVLMKRSADLAVLATYPRSSSSAMAQTAPH